jgi:5-methylcytosine-specific restriction endonuclease McrA
LAKQKHAATNRPRDRIHEPLQAEGSSSRHIPAQVKRVVWHRDGGQCAFVGTAGRRCDERGFLEFHHVVPYSEGGAASVDNIQLRCRAHNGYEFERVFARGKMLEVREISVAYLRFEATRPGASWTLESISRPQPRSCLTSSRAS